MVVGSSQGQGQPYGLRKRTRGAGQLRGSDGGLSSALCCASSSQARGGLKESGCKMQEAFEAKPQAMYVA